MKIEFYKAYLIMSLFLCTLPLYSQNQLKSDSLQAVYSSKTYDAEKELDILWAIALNSTRSSEILVHANKLIDLASQAPSNIWLYRGYLERGNSYRLSGDYQKALDSYFISADHAGNANYQLGVASAFTAVGDIYSVNEDHSNSISYYKKAINEFRLSQDSVELASALLNIGDEYFNNNDLDSALTYLLESKDIFQRKNYEIGVAYALGNIGLVYAKLDMNNLAEGHINQATAVLEKLGDRYPIAVYQTYMADIYKEKGDLKTALEYADKSLKIGEEEGFKEQIRDASLKLSELYQSAQNFEKAYQYQSQYLAFRDSINNEETIRKIADLRTEYEVSRKQTEVDLLNASAENQRILVINLILIVLLFAAVAYLYFHRSKARLKMNKLISQQKLETENQRDQLELLNETKDKFFSIISHDLRSPVANFKGVSYIMKKLVDAYDKEKLIHLCEQLDKSASELTTLLDNLLQWALSQQGRFPHNPEKIDLFPIVASTFSVLESTARAKDIEMTHVIEGKLELFVDKNSAETIIRNLISNALKFTPEGGKVTLTASVNINMAEIKISDNGVGMPNETVNSLFDFKAKKSKWGTKGEKGVGLGLFLVKDFAELNEGSISVESEVGVGSTFIVNLPLA